LSKLKKEFGGGDDESAKVAELKIVEQEEKIIEVSQTSFSLYFYN